MRKRIAAVLSVLLCILIGFGIRVDAWYANIFLEVEHLDGSSQFFDSYTSAKDKIEDGDVLTFLGNIQETSVTIDKKITIAIGGYGWVLNESIFVNEDVIITAGTNGGIKASAALFEVAEGKTVDYTGGLLVNYNVSEASAACIRIHSGTLRYVGSTTFSNIDASVAEDAYISGYGTESDGSRAVQITPKKNIANKMKTMASLKTYYAYQEDSLEAIENSSDIIASDSYIFAYMDIEGNKTYALNNGKKEESYSLEEVENIEAPMSYFFQAEESLDGIALRSGDYYIVSKENQLSLEAMDSITANSYSMYFEAENGALKVKDSTLYLSNREGKLQFSEDGPFIQIYHYVAPAITDVLPSLRFGATITAAEMNQLKKLGDNLEFGLLLGEQSDLTLENATRDILCLAIPNEEKSIYEIEYVVGALMDFEEIYYARIYVKSGDMISYFQVKSCSAKSLAQTYLELGTLATDNIGTLALEKIAE